MSTYDWYSFWELDNTSPLKSINRIMDLLGKLNLSDRIIYNYVDSLGILSLLKESINW